eukprot:UN18745
MFYVPRVPELSQVNFNIKLFKMDDLKLEYPETTNLRDYIQTIEKHCSNNSKYITYLSYFFRRFNSALFVATIFALSPIILFWLSDNNIVRTPQHYDDNIPILFLFTCLIFLCTGLNIFFVTVLLTIIRKVVKRLFELRLLTTRLSDSIIKMDR